MSRRRLVLRVSDSERSAMWVSQDGACALCGVHIPEDRLNTRAGRQAFTHDHIESVAHGGADDLVNLQIVHRSCGEAKGCGCPVGAGPTPGRRCVYPIREEPEYG